MIRIYILIGLAFLIYYGYDGMRGDQELRKLTINELQSSGSGESRYLEITDCFTTGAFVYEYEEGKSEFATKVIIPIIDKESFMSEMQRIYIGDSLSDENWERPKVFVVVQRSESSFTGDCAKGDGSCADDLVNFITSKDELTGFSIKGMTQVGLDALPDKDKELIQSLDYDLHDEVLFLEEGAEPKGTGMALLMIIGGIIGVVLTILSYRL